MATTIYERWVDLAAHLLVDDGDDPLAAVAAELAQDFEAVGRVLRTGTRAVVTALLAEAREEGRPCALVLPFADGPGPPWVVLTRRTPLTPAEREDVVRVHRLAVGLVRGVRGPPGRTRPGSPEEAIGVSWPTGEDGARDGRRGPGSPPADPVAVLRPDADGSPRRVDPAPEAGVALTDRERDVLRLMAEGLIARAIGHRLGVSVRTVTKHQERIYRKLRACDRLTAVLRAQEAGLVGAARAVTAPSTEPGLEAGSGVVGAVSGAVPAASV